MLNTFGGLVMLLMMGDAALDPGGWAGIVRWGVKPAWLRSIFADQVVSDGGRQGERQITVNYRFDHPDPTKAKTNGTLQFVFDDLGQGNYSLKHIMVKPAERESPESRTTVCNSLAHIMQQKYGKYELKQSTVGRTGYFAGVDKRYYWEFPTTFINLTVAEYDVPHTAQCYVSYTRRPTGGSF